MPEIHKLIIDRLKILLADELGSYRLPNGAVVPSYAVIPPQLDGRIEVAEPGIEMIVYKTLMPKPLPIFSAGVENYYRILLTQRNTSSDLSKAIALIMSEFDRPEMKTPQLQEEDERRGLRLEQVVFLISEEKFTNQVNI